MKTLRLGTRKSTLAQVQATWVAKQLEKNFPELRVELVLITTSGDEASPGLRPPSPDGRGNREAEGEATNLKALFTKEIEESLLSNKIDLAVHSLKDMAADLPQGLVISAIPEREDPSDAWISKNKMPFTKLAAGNKVGTGAIRRQAQLLHVRPGLDIVAIRGNVDTRLKKLESENLDGIVLARAGLRRLGLEARITEVLPLEVMLPAVGQGCLAIETRAGDRSLDSYLKSIDHPESHQAAIAERAFLKALGGSCKTPIACHAILEAGKCSAAGLVISPDGTQVAKGAESGRAFDAAGVGERLAAKLLAAGAEKILSGQGIRARN